MKQPGPADLLLMRGQYNFNRAVRCRGVVVVCVWGGDGRGGCVCVWNTVLILLEAPPRLSGADLSVEWGGRGTAHLGSSGG